MVTLEQLKENCSCVSEMNEDEFNKIFSKFVRFLSSILCWDIANGSILVEDRVQTVDIKDCNTCYFIQPYYKNIDPNSIDIQLRQYSPDGVNILPLNVFEYDEFDDKIMVKPSDCLDCSCQNCSRYVLVIRYKAGFDLDTDEWLDIICHFFTAYISMANDCFTLKDCCKQNEMMLAAKLTTKKVGEISYTWEVDKESEEYLFKNLMTNYYFRLLSKYALCGRNYLFDENIWFGRSRS